MNYSQQIDRIRIKLIEAKKKDSELKEFGADSHRYELGKPVSLEEVYLFEEEYDLDLPEAYIEFVTKLGNGGPGDYGGAGPDYGIYELGEFEYMESTAPFMADPSVINSQLTEEKWKRLTAFEEKLSRDSIEYDRKYNALFSGLMAIGTKGSSFQNMLIVTGEDKGKVAYIDQDLMMPVIKEDFLDWYEAWLDRVIDKKQ